MRNELVAENDRFEAGAFADQRVVEATNSGGERGHFCVDDICCYPEDCGFPNGVAELVCLSGAYQKRGDRERKYMASPDHCFAYRHTPRYLHVLFSRNSAILNCNTLLLKYGEVWTTHPQFHRCPMKADNVDIGGGFVLQTGSRL